MRRSRGLTKEQLKKYRGPLYVHSDAFLKAWDQGLRLVMPQANATAAAAAGKGGDAKDTDNSQFGRVASLLVSGPSGSGRTAFAAGLASFANFSYMGVLSADDLRGAPEQSRLDALTRISDDAVASDTSVILLDDIERLVGHVSSNGPSKDELTGAIVEQGSLQASTALIEGVLALLRTRPPIGCSLMIIATTAVKPLLGRTALLGGFDSLLSLPQLEEPTGLLELLRLSGAAGSANELHHLQGEIPAGTTLKQVMRAMELSRVPPPPPPPIETNAASASATSTTTVSVSADGAEQQTKTTAAEAQAESSSSASAESSGLGVGSPLVLTPIDHIPIDHSRFAELLSTRAAVGAPAHYEPPSIVKVVNSSAELEEERWTEHAQADALVVEPAV